MRIPFSLRPILLLLVFSVLMLLSAFSTPPTSSLSTQRPPQANFPAGITGIRAFLTADVGVRIAGAFSASSSIT